MTSQPQQRTRRRRIFTRWRVLGLFGAAAALPLVAYWFVLPWLLHDRLAAAVTRAGIPNVTFRVASASPWSASLRDIRVGDGTLASIERLDARYSLRDIW